MLGFGSPPSDKGSSAGSSKSPPNGKLSFGDPANNGKAKPKENVTVKIHRNQIVECIIPHSTPRAREIRETVKDLTDDNQYVFIFRPMSAEPAGWTTVSRQSTNIAPVLTATPVRAVNALDPALKQCDAVGKITYMDVHSNQSITVAQVGQLMFDALPGQEAPSAPAPDQFAGDDAELDAPADPWTAALAEDAPVTRAQCVTMMETLQSNIEAALSKEVTTLAKIVEHQSTCIKEQLIDFENGFASKVGHSNVGFDDAELGMLTQNIQSMHADITEAVALVKTHTDHIDALLDCSTQLKQNVKGPKKELKMTSAIAPSAPTNVDELRKALIVQKVPLPLDTRPLSFYQDLWTKHIGHHFRSNATAETTDTPETPDSSSKSDPKTHETTDAVTASSSKRARKQPVPKS
jgi:hypothetical protein